MTEKVFLSHSSDDQALVNTIRRSLNIVDVEAVAYELEDSKDDEEDREAIRRLMRECSACYVFPTKAARSSQITSAWLVAEASIAQDQDLPVIIFKEHGADHEINFPYFQALVVYDRMQLSLHLQEQMKEISKMSPKTEAGLAGGFLGGILVGTLGGAVGGALLLAALAEDDDTTGEQVKCPRCDVRFGYIGEFYGFRCPHCHTEMNIEDNAI